MSGRIEAAQKWPTNAELIADVAKLYLRPDDVVCDLTYGKGIWWQLYRPELFVAHDLKLDGVNFCQLPEGDGTYSVIGFDPPYVAQGGRKTSTVPAFTGAYGLDDAPRTPRELHDKLIAPGLAEAFRVLVPSGICLLKVKDYVSSGKVQWAASIWAHLEAERVGFKVIDRFDHIGDTGPQPLERKRRNRKTGEWYIAPTEWKHAARNMSYLYVLRKPGRRPKQLAVPLPIQVAS